MALRIGLPLPASRTGGAVGALQVVSVITNEGLTRVGHDGRPQPQLAERWEHRDGGRSLQIFLRHGLKFHDGTPLTADLLKASLNRSRAMAQQARQFPTLGDIVSIDAASATQIVLRLKQPSALLLEDLEVPISEVGPDGRMLSAGPFYLSSASADQTELRANPHYHAGRPAIDTIQVKTYPTVRMAWTGMMRDEIDFLYQVPNDAREFVEKESSVRVFSFLRPYVYTLIFNVKRPVFRSPAVRAALNFAVDRQALIDLALRGRGVPARGPVWPAHYAYSIDLPGYRYDPVEADRLLDEAGLKGGGQPPAAGHMPSRMRFSCLIPENVSPHEQVALLLQKQFFDLGVDMQIAPVSIETFVRRNAAGDYDRGGQGTFDRIVHNIRQVADRCQISIGGNFDESSVDSFPGLLDFLKEQEFADKLVKVAFKPIIAPPKPAKQPGVFALTAVGGDGKPLNGTCMTSAGAGGSSPCDNCHFVEEKMSFLRDETKKRGFPTPDGVHMGPCEIHRRHAYTIGPDGSLYACPGFTGEATQSVGHIDGRQESRQQQAGAAFEALAAWKQCGDCSFIPVCAGGCSVASHAELGDMNTPTCHKPSFESALLSLAHDVASAA